FARPLAALGEGGERQLIPRCRERGNVAEYSWRAGAATWREGDDVAEKTLDLVRSTVAASKTIGLEKRSWFLTAAVAEALAAGLPDSSIVDASLLVDRVRLTQSQATV